MYKTWSVLSHFGFGVIVKMLDLFNVLVHLYTLLNTVHCYTLVFQFGVHKEKGSVCFCAFM